MTNIFYNTDKVEKENAYLKSQLSNIKKLYRLEVEKIINANIFYDEDGEVNEVYPEDIITAICNLAIPKIDRDRIPKAESKQKYHSLVG